VDQLLEAFGRQFEALAPFLDERIKRLYAASMAKELGHGGINQISELTKISQETIAKGIKELGDP
jgi:hypothetical protein